MPETPQLQVQCNATIGSLHINADITVTQPWTVLFGPSGSGKSSLLRLIAGLWQPKESRVLLGANDLTHTPAHKRRIALVAQQPALFPNMDVRANVIFGLPPMRSTEVNSMADSWLLQFDAFELAFLKPRQLSGGQIKRVAVARALATVPTVLLLDEAFSGLNTSASATLRNTLREWQRNHNMPIIAVTHDLQEALEADEVLRMEAGRITAQGNPNEVLSDEKAAMLASLTRR